MLGMVKMLGAAGCLAGALVIGAGPASAETKILFNTYLPLANPIMQAGAVPWAKAVEEATKGRVKVDFTASSLAPPPRQIDMVRSGVADAAMTLLGFTRGQIILPMVAEIPLTNPVDSAAAQSVALWRTHEKYFAKANEFEGLKVITLWSMPGNDVFTATKPMRKLDDVKGLKIRSNPDGAAMMGALGAVMVSRPASESYELVTRGVADGTVLPDWALIGFNLADHVKYRLSFPGGLSSSTVSIVMNKAKWDALSADDKAAIEKVQGEALSKIAGDVLNKASADATKALQDRGVQTLRADAAMVAEMDKRMAGRVEEWIKLANAKGVDGKAAFEFYLAESKKLEKH